MKNKTGWLVPAGLSMSLGVNAADLGDITVTGTREETPRAETPATVDAIGGQTIEDTRPGHPSEVMGRIPGVHVSVTGGEGHTTAIRQPVGTSPVYLYLEDGIPTRSTGFFNHNALYEVNVPQAGGIEVTKGPGTSLYGSDAIGGVVNILTRPAPLEPEAALNIEAGEFGWTRLLASGGNSWEADGLRGDLNLTHTDGWRDGTEYDRQSGTVRWDRSLDSGAAMKTVLAISKIDQQTAGSSAISEADFLDNPTANYTPISYRDVLAVRLSTALEKESAHSLWSVTPYLRHNVMEYMPNWSFTYDPNITETKNDSLGLLLKYRYDFAPMRTRFVVGADIDYSPGSRLEHSINAVKDGSIYTSYTVTDKIYDYDVTFQGISPYAHLELSPTDRLRLNAGVRYDVVRYDYDNKMTDGLTTVARPTSMFKDVDYNHPSDMTVDFDHLSPKLGATYAFTPRLNGFASYRHAFRTPSEGQLFRPAQSINTTGLEPVKVDSYEVGLRGKGTNFDYELSVYYMTKEDDIVTFTYPDDTREVMNAGETLHQGVEVGLGSRLSDSLRLSVAYAYSEHTFEEWQPNSTTDYSGNEMSSAPKEIASLRLDWRPAALKGGRLEVEWDHLGSYWMDDANTVEYDGHDLWNLRANYPIGKLQLYGRVMNLTDERYATRAIYTTFRGEEFAPGMPRTFYAGINYSF